MLETVYHIGAQSAQGGTMKAGYSPDGLRLTEEEAYSLLSLCLTSPNRLDATSEKALRKLAEYCTTQCNLLDNNHVNQEYDKLVESARAI
jgi:hypothetical protein